MHYKQYKYLFLIYKEDEGIFIYGPDGVVTVIVERNLQMEYTWIPRV
jgi:hypothetical protein